MVASTLKLGIAILNGGNSTVQQVFQSLLSYILVHEQGRIYYVITIFALYLKGASFGKPKI